MNLSKAEVANAAHEESEEQKIHELRAKGSLKKPIDHKLGDEFERRSDRGSQRGFGRNQGKEAIDRTTDHGTRAGGTDHG